MMDALMDMNTSEDEREGNGFLQGLAAAVVTDNHDPDDLGRVRVRVAWQPDSQQSYWARVATPMAMADRGIYFLPEVDDEVLVGFEQGDLTHPFVLGALYSGKRKPPHNNSNGKNESRVIRSRKNSELHFFDGDPPSVELKLEDGKQVLMDDTGIKISDGSNTIQIDTGSKAVTVTSAGDLNLQAGTSLTLDAGSSISVSASGTVTISGSMVQIN